MACLGTHRLLPCRTLTANIRRRRGSKVAMNMPIFHDSNTPRPFKDPTIPYDRDKWPEDSSELHYCHETGHVSVLTLDRTQTHGMAQLCRTTSTWTQWDLEWAAAASRSPSKHAASMRLGGCTTRSCPLVQSWSAMTGLCFSCARFGS